MDKTSGKADSEKIADTASALRKAPVKPEPAEYAPVVTPYHRSLKPYIIFVAALTIIAFAVLAFYPQAPSKALAEAAPTRVVGTFTPMGISGNVVKADVGFAVSSGNGLGVNPCFEVSGVSQCDGYTCIQTSNPVPGEYANRTFTVYDSYAACLLEREEVPECLSDGDCAAGMICANGSCAQRPCVAEGGGLQTGDSCCFGLSGLACSSLTAQGCRPCTGTVCAACGNGACGAGENECNCPEDCKEEAPQEPLAPQGYSCSSQLDKSACPIDDCQTGYSCMPNAAKTSCSCVPDNASCGAPGDEACAGECPEGELCVSGQAGCACVKDGCGDGICNLALGENCECPDCAVPCPEGTHCNPDAADADILGCSRMDGGCGDDKCSAGESCSSCPADCGACPGCVLGDLVINSGEECDNDTACFADGGKVCSPASCTCITPECADAQVPYCLGACGAGMRCVPSGASCLCVPEGETYDVPVLSLSFIPPKPDNPNLVDISITSDDAFLHEGNTVQYVRGRISTLRQRLMDALERGSTYHGYKDPGATPSLDYSIYEHKEYLEPVPTALSDSFDGMAPYYQLWQLNTVSIGDYMLIDMRANRTINNITIYFWNVDYPAKYRVEASGTGAFAGEQVTLLTQTTKVYCGPGEWAPDHHSICPRRYSFSNVTARYIKIIMDENYGNQLNIFDVFVGSPIPGAKVSFSRNNVAYSVHHRLLLTDYVDVCDYVDNHGVKEVWVWMYHNDAYPPLVAPVESFQRGPSGAFGNGWMDLPLCGHTYTVYDYNYGRELGMALENHIHHIEIVFKYVNQVLFDGSFIGPSGPGQPYYRCGWCHVTPNGMQFLPWPEYNWMITTPALSDCEDWTPAGTGAKTNITCLAWKNVFTETGAVYTQPGCISDGGLAYKVWWMENVPGKGNMLYSGAQKMRNWWAFVGDFDDAVAEGKSFFE